MRSDATSSDVPTQRFVDDLVAAGLLIPAGARGVYGRGAVFEDVRGRFAAVVSAAAADEHPERLAFPPLVPRENIETLGYLSSFPHLAGTIFAFEGDDVQAAEQAATAAAHGDWSAHQRMTDLVLRPAACYSVYPAIARRGPLPGRGVTVDTGSAYVFRHEPSDDPARLQMFHMRELVRIATPEVVQAWRDAWLDRSLALLASLGLEVGSDVANDPFFGRTGRMLAANQREQALKFEIRAPIAGAEPVAVASFNYHQEHFAHVFGLALEDGGTAHSACLGFGEERVVLALFRQHGLDAESWPEPVRRLLWPEAARGA
jgi:seryl-tRNA synthetase